MDFISHVSIFSMIVSTLANFAIIILEGFEKESLSQFLKNQNASFASSEQIITWATHIAYMISVE